MTLIIDNYDSFTYNLVQYVGEFDKDITVLRNDEFSIDDLKNMNFKRIIVSPGPCYPKDAGESPEVIKAFYTQCPILGVCLGHQTIGWVFGANIIHASQIMHGKISQIDHDEKHLFNGLKSPLKATRYHSLVVEEQSLPKDFEITARSEDKTIMGLKHKDYPLFGVQFHPESILTDNGKQMIQNFIAI